MTADILSASIMTEAGEVPEPVPELPAKKFRSWINGVERYDTDQYIYLRVEGRLFRVSNTNPVKVYLLSLKYRDDLGV